MPTTPTPVVPNFEHVFQNPTFLFGGVGVPVPGARLSLDQTSGTPDFALNPNSFWLGTSVEGAKFTAGFEIDDLEVDEYQGIVDSKIVKTVTSLEVNLYELLDLDRLQKIVPNTTFVTGSGFEQITAGGLVTLPMMSIVAISTDPGDDTKLIVLQLYKAANKTPLEFPMSRKNRATMPVKFEGYDITTRPRGDRHWTMWKQVPVAP